MALGTALRIGGLLVAAAAAGCSHTPGYFPYVMPGGPIVQDHAKPGGPGYFRNFDPKACKIEVSPPAATAPLGAQIVLVASVLDKDGQPRRSRRVEWLIEGPGNIVEADESGVYPGRGYKVDNKYAVGYTSYRSHTITRGNSDGKDDVAVAAGQTFCVISSAVPGETIVTAYAPEVFNWESGRVLVRVVWGDGGFTFPPPSVVRYGGECTLTTTRSKTDRKGEPQENYTVRYRLIDPEGAPAVLVNRGTLSGSEAETPVDSTTGAAAVRLVQQLPKAGKTRVLVEVLKPTETGVGPGIVISRRETSVEWASPQLRVDVNAPTAAGLTGEVPVVVSLVNVGVVDGSKPQVRINLSDGAVLARSEPPPSRQDAKGLIFDLAKLPAGAKRDITLQVKPAQLGAVTVTADAITADGMDAQGRATTIIEKGRIGVVVDVPGIVLTSDRIPARVSVTNSGSTPARNVMVWAQLDAGLTHASGKNPVELSGGTLNPGETRVLELPLNGKSTGRFTVRANATADGELSAAAEPTSFEVRRAELGVTVASPKLVYLNQDVTWTVTVSNTGESPVVGVVVKATLPPEVLLKDAGEVGKPGSGALEWRVGEMKPGDKRTFQLVAASQKLTDRAVVSVVASGDVLSGADAKPVGDPVQARGESATAIIGTPALVLEVATPPGPVEVGKPVLFQVRVKNTGTIAARAVVVNISTSPELRTTSGTGPTPGQPDAAGKLAFGAIEELPPGQSATFKVTVNPLRAGAGRLRAEVIAEHLSGHPVSEEQSIRVVGVP